MAARAGSAGGGRAAVVLGRPRRQHARQRKRTATHTPVSTAVGLTSEPPQWCFHTTPPAPSLYGNLMRTCRATARPVGQAAALSTLQGRSPGVFGTRPRPCAAARGSQPGERQHHKRTAADG